jgi:hypothetical protein
MQLKNNATGEYSLELLVPCNPINLFYIIIFVKEPAKKSATSE